MTNCTVWLLNGLDSQLSRRLNLLGCKYCLSAGRTSWMTCTASLIRVRGQAPTLASMIPILASNHWIAGNRCSASTKGWANQTAGKIEILGSNNRSKKLVQAPTRLEVFLKEEDKASKKLVLAKQSASRLISVSHLKRTLMKFQDQELTQAYCHSSSKRLLTRANTPSNSE